MKLSQLVKKNIRNIIDFGLKYKNLRQQLQILYIDLFKLDSNQSQGNLVYQIYFQKNNPILQQQILRCEEMIFDFVRAITKNNLMRNLNEQQLINLFMLQFPYYLQYFQKLDKDQQLRFSNLVKYVSFQKGKKIFKKGKSIPYIYFIIKGSVKRSDGAIFGQFQDIGYEINQNPKVFTVQYFEFDYEAEKDTEIAFINIDSFSSFWVDCEFDQLKKQLEILRKIEIFRNYNDTDILIRLVKNMKAQNYILNQTIYDDGEKQENVYFLIKGQVKLLKAIKVQPQEKDLFNSDFTPKKLKTFDNIKFFRINQKNLKFYEHSIITEGQYFGNIQDFRNLNNCKAVCTTETALIYVLNSQVFQNIFMNRYQEQFQQLKSQKSFFQKQQNNIVNQKLFDQNVDNSQFQQLFNRQNSYRNSIQSKMMSLDKQLEQHKLDFTYKNSVPNSCTFNRRMSIRTINFSPKKKEKTMVKSQSEMVLKKSTSKNLNLFISTIKEPQEINQKINDLRMKAILKTDVTQRSRQNTAKTSRKNFF